MLWTAVVWNQTDLLLAVVPAMLDETTTRTIRGYGNATIAQHGWEHRDHAATGMKKIELGGKVDRVALASVLARGRGHLATTFGARYSNIMVPPWNRIDDDVAACLSSIGFAGISTYADHDVREISGLRQINTHIDAIAWRAGKRNLAFEELVDRLHDAIRMRFPSPIGLLTHHMAMDDAGFAALRRFFCLLARQENVLWGSAGQYLGSGD